MAFCERILKQARRALNSNVVCGIILAIVSLATPVFGESGWLRFEKQIFTDQYYCDGIMAGDINRGGKMDVIARPFWYEGPGFTNQREFYPATVFPTEPSPTDAMFSYVYGFNWWINGIKPDGQRKYPGTPPDTYCGGGFNNNRLFVIPEWNMVIVRLGLDGNACDTLWTGFPPLRRRAKANWPACAGENGTNRPVASRQRPQWRLV